MQVTVEQSGALERKMTVTLPAEQFDAELNKQLMRLSRQVKVPGFRPGKVPMKIIKSRYQEQVMQDVIGELVQHSYQEALVQEKLHPAGRPAIETGSVGEGQAFEYTAVFEIYPDLSGLAIDNLKVERPVCEISDADIDRTIESLRKQRVSWNVVERAAGEGDRVMLDFRGTVDGEPFAGGEGKEMPVVIGSGSLIEGFEEQLKGISAGEERVVEVDFPADYHSKDLAGKSARFEVKATEVAEQKLPEIDEALAESFGVTEGGIEKFREEVRDNLSREAEDRLRVRLRDSVFQALLDSNEIEVPQSLLEQEYHQLMESASKEQPEVADNTEIQALYRRLAERRVALGLVLAEVTARKQLKPDPAEVDRRLGQLAESYEDADAFIKWYKSDRRRMSEIEAQVLENAVVQDLLESAEVTETPVSFEALVNPAGAAPQEDSSS